MRIVSELGGLLLVTCRQVRDCLGRTDVVATSDNEYGHTQKLVR